MRKSLTSTLIFQLKPDEDGERLLNNGQLEAQRVVNEVFRLDQEGYDCDKIEEIIQESRDSL